MESDINDRQNIGMFEHFEQAGFLDKIITFLLRIEVDAVQQFDRNGAIKNGVLASVDAAKRAAGDFFYYLVIADMVIYACHNSSPSKPK